MATLTGKTIADTYTSLLKLEGNTQTLVARASGSAIQVKTGDNEATPLYLNTDAAGIGTSTPDGTLQVGADGTDSSVWLSNYGQWHYTGGTGTIGFDTKKNMDFKIDSDANDTTEYFRFLNASTELIRIKANGNVGIGTNDPASLLHIYHTDGGDPDLTIEHVGGVGQGGGNIIFKQRETGGYVNDGITLGQMIFQSYDNDSGSSGTYRTSAKIIATAAHAQEEDQLSANMSFWVNNHSQNPFQAMTLQYDGNLGIGTTSPNAKLHIENTTQDEKPQIYIVNKSATDAHDGGEIRFYREDTGAHLGTTGLSLGDIKFIGKDASGNSLIGAQITGYVDGGDAGTNDLPSGLKFMTNPGVANATTSMTIDKNGNVGIGESSPDGLLHITSGTDDRPWVIIEQTSTSQQQGGNLLFRNADTDTQLADDVILGDIVWQGWNTAGTPDYESACMIRGRKDGASGGDNDMGGELQFLTTDDDSTTLDQRMCIRHNGNVGIGTTAPDKALEINNSSGNCLRLTYNDANGSASNAVDFSVSSGGDLTIDPSGSDITLADINTLNINSRTASGSNQPFINLKATFDTASHQGPEINFQSNLTDGYISSGKIIGDITFQTLKSNNSSAMDSAIIRCQTEEAHDTDSSGAGLRFFVMPSGNSQTIAQVMGITSASRVGINETSPDTRLHVKETEDTTYAMTVENTDADNPYGINISFSASSNLGDETDDAFLVCRDSDGAHFSVYGDGDAVNVDNSYTSDARIKDDIVDATSKLADVNSLKVRNFVYKHKDGTKSTKKRIGFIADELETVFPSVVHKRNLEMFGHSYDDMKTIRYSALIPILVKAIQELSAKVTALENA